MTKRKIPFINIVYWLAIIAADLFIYLIFGLSEMDYDDNYDASKGEYGSFASMTKWQLVFFFSLQVWNILNLIGIIYIGRKIYKRLRKHAGN